MSFLKKEDVLKLLNDGHTLYAHHTPNFGTASLSKPITTGLKDTVKYKINDLPVHHKTYAGISNKLAFVTSKRQGLSTIKEFKLKYESEN